MNRTETEHTVHQALTKAYWGSNGYSPRQMGREAATALGITAPDLDQLARIVGRNLQEPDFITMARQVAEALAGASKPSEFSVRSKHTEHHFVVSESEDGWNWESFEGGTCLDQGPMFASSEEACQDAIRYAREKEEEWLDGVEDRLEAYAANLACEQKVERLRDERQA